MKNRKKQRRGESNPVGTDRFLGEQCYLCVFLSLHTLSSTHTHTQTMLWRELTNLCGEEHASKTFTLQAQRLQRQHSRLTKKPSRNRNTVKLRIQICVSMLAVASRCQFIYMQHCMGARGEEYRRPTEAVNSSHGKPESR